MPYSSTRHILYPVRIIGPVKNQSRVFHRNSCVTPVDDDVIKYKLNSRDTTRQINIFFFSFFSEEYGGNLQQKKQSNRSKGQNIPLKGLMTLTT